MTSKELDNQLYGIDCDFEMIDSDISILVEQLRHDRREMAKVTEELKVGNWLVTNVFTMVKNDKPISVPIICINTEKIEK